MSIQKIQVVLVLLSTVTLSACGGSSSKPAEAPEAPAESAEPAPAADPASGTAEGLAALAEVEKADAAPADAPPQKETGREVIYRMTPDGLKVEVEGAVFAVAAQSYVKPEGYGVEVFVEATAKVEGTLANPTAGPIAFAGKVVRKTGRVDQFGDRKGGNGTKPLGPSSPQKFSRKWPIENVSLLSPGDVLELQVGLWGYAPSNGKLRPVRKFATVTMKATEHGASPVVDAPAQ
jgi:hypothetical protein